MATSVEFGFNTPFKEQLGFFRQKINLPSEYWDDIKKAANDRAFYVAGVGKADLLMDLRGAIDKAISEGKGIQDFRKDFKSIVARHGWTGWTGEGTKAGEAWRTRIMYSTNMSTSYAAGRYKQLTDPEYLKLRPLWTYNHADGVAHPRPHHLSWNKVTLPYDHSFWKTHYCPNGWLCHCYITSARPGTPLKQPPAGWDALDPKTGAPIGIDKGFDYAPGASVQAPLRQFVQEKLINYPPAIARALSKELNRKIEATDPADVFAAQALADRSTKDPLYLGFVERADEFEKLTKQDMQGYLVTLTPDSVRHVVDTHQFDGAGQRPIVPGDFNQVIQVLNDYDTIELGNTSRHGQPSIVVTKDIDGEQYRLVFNVLAGKRNLSVQLVSMVVKTSWSR